MPTAQPEINANIRNLIDRGVIIPSPGSVEIDESVVPHRIAPGAIIHRGCRIVGAKTSIGPGAELGAEAPVTVEDCQLGHDVELNGGYFSGATFLDGAHMGSCAHIRPGTLMEEEAGGAHAVGFKQTIFLSFVKAGSLINFCDALMGGGTSRENHSEIGSSYIHFNFTPHQDKATPSLIGDVPRGVMLDQPPIFLGGQGGLVGPVRIAYGTVIPAGIICRQDILEERQLYSLPITMLQTRKFALGIYRGINRIMINNLIYIGNLWALKTWYQSVRKRTMAGDPFVAACHAGALEQIDAVLGERIKRLKDLAGKMPYSLERARVETGENLPPKARLQQETLVKKWPAMEAGLKHGPAAGTGAAQRDLFLKEWEKVAAGTAHTQAIAGISKGGRKAGTAWLQTIVDSMAKLWKTI